MNLKDEVKWASTKAMWDTKFEPHRPEIVRVIPVEALRARLEKEHTLCGVCAKMLAELEE